MRVNSKRLKPRSNVKTVPGLKIIILTLTKTRKLKVKIVRTFVRTRNMLPNENHVTRQ